MPVHKGRPHSGFTAAASLIPRLRISGATRAPLHGIQSSRRSADRIHILDQGHIVESGTHEELLALEGRYARMYEVQARAYSAEPGAPMAGGAEPPAP